MDIFTERLYRINDHSFKKCGTSIMLINQIGNILYKILPISNFTEARFYQLAYQNSFESDIHIDTHSDDTININGFEDVNFLVRNKLIPKIYGFYYIKHILLDNNEVWGIVSQHDDQCSIAIAIENIIHGYELPAVADIKLGLSYPLNYTYDQDIIDDIPRYIDRWREIKTNIRTQYSNDPIRANALIREITPEMIGLPSKYSNYSTDEIYKLLKKWRQIQASNDTTQATLGLRICSMNYINSNSQLIDVTSNASKGFNDDECIHHIKEYFKMGKLSRLLNKLDLLYNWISNQNLSFCATSLLIVFDHNNLDKFDARWIDFNYIIPLKKCCDVNVLKGLHLLRDLCII